MNTCTLEYHAALKEDRARFIAECEYRYEWNLDGHVVHMWQHRACQSDLSGPVRE